MNDLIYFSLQIIAKNKGLDWKSNRILGILQKSLNESLSNMSEISKKILHPEPYTREEVCQILDITDDELMEISLNENTKTLTEFKVGLNFKVNSTMAIFELTFVFNAQLYQRAKHVYEEANRVWKFKSICESGSATALKELGQLMNDSHESCCDWYECSHPELDELVKVSRKAGALGSRLTGAG